MSMFRQLRGVGSNHCPDEKGTESIASQDLMILSPYVATIAPMKRGLKGPPNDSSRDGKKCSNHCPDEKGTESRPMNPKMTNRVSSNHCPDEKGTERRSADTKSRLVLGSNHCPDEKGTERPACQNPRFLDTCSNHCPDEKGTERIPQSPCVNGLHEVATIAPMKRGLKVN